MRLNTLRSLSMPKRTRWLVSALTIVGLLALAVGAATPARATGNGTPPLQGSTFEAGDGDLTSEPNSTPPPAFFHDWNLPVSGESGSGPIQAINCGTVIPTQGTNCSTDLSKSTADNAFGQGTKEDNPNVTIVNGSIPPNKSDLTRFYVNTEFVVNNTNCPQGCNFLYLAWERSNVLGSANMDFEINQTSNVATLCNTCTGAATITRTAGDLLVTYDFTGGGSIPTLGLLRWVTTGSNSQCFASNGTVPCWGNAATINSSDSQGAINTDTETDTNPPNAPASLPALTFGEAGINLTTAGVFPTGTCVAFGSAFLKSRSSASFTSEVKDFISPIAVPISNCGEITIIKHTDPRGLNQNFSYTSTIAGPQVTCATPSSFTLNDNGNTTGDNAANTEDCKNVLAGSYTVTEGAEPANFTLESLTCKVEGPAGSSGAQDGTNPFQADITIVPNGHVTCTYVNKGSGAILITKTAKNHKLGPGLHPLAGATFMVNGVSKMTDANGQACFDGLDIKTYTVTETQAPPGYSIDTTSQSVTITSAASCTSGTPATVSFTDTPLTDVVITATSEVSGVTNSTITCVIAGSSTNIGNSPQGPTDPVTVTANGLKPGTYTCTVVIDP